MMQSTGAVIFDLDDVLYPQWEYALGGYRAVADYMMTVYGTPVYKELAKKHQSNCTERLLTDVLSGHFENVEPDFLNRLIAVYWAHKPRIKLFEDARICLAFMQTMNVRTGIVTDGRSDIQRTKIKALDLFALIEQVVFVSDLLGDRKMTDSLQMAELLMGVPLAGSIYVGNGISSDFQTARMLGMRTVMVKRPAKVTGQEPAPDAGPEPTTDITIPSLAELHHIIDPDQHAFEQRD